MLSKLSRATCYLETFYICQSGLECLRSYATGFFIRTHSSILLITNWHVVTGLNPSESSMAKKPSPHLMKATVISKSNVVTALTLPLYDENLSPLWFEHRLGSAVDLAIYELPSSLEKYFNFVDIHSVEDSYPIDECVANDVFILGYPFSRKEFQDSFGHESAYYLPIWKRGSIAFEPSLRLNKHVLLIDALSRPGMSGAPIFMAEDKEQFSAQALANKTQYVTQPDSALSRIMNIDPSSITFKNVKRFRFLGVYSGVFGTTKLVETALGKCWHVDSLREAIENPQKGLMRCHAPFENSHYLSLLEQSKGKLIIKDTKGNVREEFTLRK